MPEWNVREATSELRARLSSLRLSPERETEIIEELSQHMDDRRQELIVGGATPEQAIRLMLAEFSADRLARHLALLHQSQSSPPPPTAATRWLHLDGVVTDLRHAVRELRRTPGFTIAALLVLTLGIGATTAIFSVVDAVVLRGLPFEDAQRIVAVGDRSSAKKRGKALPPGFSPPPGFDASDPDALAQVKPQNYLDWLSHQEVFESMAAIAKAEATLIVPGGEPEDLAVQRVTAGFFQVLRVRPAIGRAFAADQETDGRHRVAVLSHALWNRRFGADPSVVGQTISLDDGAYEVLGVMPDGFSYPVGAARPADLWIPYVVPPAERTRGRIVGQYLQCIARLKTGVSLDQARAQMNQVAAAIEQANPDWNQGSGVGIRLLRDHLVGASVRTWMLMLLSAVGIVLLSACANVANLLLSRATTRQRDVTIRSALGASRWRLVRSFMVESLLLSALGTVLAVALASWGIEVLRSAMPEGVPRVTAIALNLRVLIVASALALVTGLLFGVVPALYSSKPNLVDTLSQTDRAGGAGRGRRHLRNVLVVTEVALAVVLIVSSTLFIGSFLQVMRINPGVNPQGVLTMQLAQRTLPGQQPADLTPAFDEILDRLAQTPGVTHAAVANPGIPLRYNMWINGFGVRDRILEGNAAVSIKLVSPDYYETLGIPLRRGRFFNATDRSRVTVINETAARTFFGNAEPVGRIAVLDGQDRTVIGVVGDARQGTLEAAPVPEAYLPLIQSRVTSGYLVIRTMEDPYRVLPAVKTVVRGTLPNIPLRYVATMDELVAQQAAQRRVTMLMLGLLGALGLAIVAVGVYGVMAYLVAQRTREIGVRMALGATRARVIGMVLSHATLLVIVGVATGAAGAWYLAGTVRMFLFGIDPNDIRAFGVAALVLPLTALVASAIPAMRAASVDPTVALRSE